jgi:3,5-epimerase/4-reductase
MPVSDDLHSRSFVTKIIKYDHVVDFENSNSILHDLLPAAIQLADVEIQNYVDVRVSRHFGQ